jgi:hypothetical protein
MTNASEREKRTGRRPVSIPPEVLEPVGFVMEAETDVTSEVAGKPDIFVPKPCPNGCLPPQK